MLCAGVVHPHCEMGGSRRAPFFDAHLKELLILHKMRLFAFFLIILLFSVPVSAGAAPKRIISLTPVGTEMLFALGQGPNIIGVTRFCDYPPEALKKTDMGDFAALNFETLISMKTDLLVLQDMHKQFAPQLDKLKIPYIILKQNNINEICDSIVRLGKICASEKKASELVNNIRADVAAVAAKVKGHPKKRVLLCISRELSEPQINSFYVAGSNNFYNELISIAGGENASKEKKISYPQVSLEGLMMIDPDVIIDLVGERKFYHSKDNIDLDTIFNEKYLKGQWMRSAAEVGAVKNGRVYIMDGTVYLRPGPRVAVILKAFAKAIHPEVKW